MKKRGIFLLTALFVIAIVCSQVAFAAGATTINTFNTTATFNYTYTTDSYWRYSTDFISGINSDSNSAPDISISYYSGVNLRFNNYYFSYGSTCYGGAAVTSYPAYLNTIAPGTYTTVYSAYMNGVFYGFVTLTTNITGTSPSFPTPSTEPTGIWGSTLSTVSLPAGYSWVNPATVLSCVGEQAYPAIYTGVGYITGNINITVRPYSAHFKMEVL